MELWSLWLGAIRHLLLWLASNAGLGMGFAIIGTTLLLKSALLPIAWPAAYRHCLRQKKLAQLQPELQKLKATWGDKPDHYVQKMRELYQRHGLAVVDFKSMLAAAVQMPVLVGSYQVLRTLGDHVRFLWIPNLMRADVGLALLAGLTTALMMLANPDLPQQLKAVMILIPCVLAVIAALKYGSALALYWSASNGFSALQTYAVHAWADRRLARRPAGT
jgi:YidC/Oxa1 family membrane protein insertase